VECIFSIVIYVSYKTFKSGPFFSPTRTCMVQAWSDAVEQYGR